MALISGEAVEAQIDEASDEVEDVADLAIAEEVGDLLAETLAGDLVVDAVRDLEASTEEPSEEIVGTTVRTRDGALHPRRSATGDLSRRA